MVKELKRKYLFWHWWRVLAISGECCPSVSKNYYKSDALVVMGMKMSAKILQCNKDMWKVSENNSQKH